MGEPKSIEYFERRGGDREDGRRRGSRYIMGDPAAKEDGRIRILESDSDDSSGRWSKFSRNPGVMYSC